jgi:hypothetical protein
MPRVDELDSIRIIAHRMQIREKIFTFFLLYYFLFTQYLYADQTRWHGCRHLHHATTRLARQQHRQHDSASTMGHDQFALAAPSAVWLSSTIASMCQHLHCIVVKSPWQRHHQHDMAAPSPAWLSIYIASRPSCPGSAIASMTQRHRHQHDSAAPSPAWLGIYIAPWPNRPDGAIANLDLGAWRELPWPAIWLGCSLPIRL